MIIARHGETEYREREKGDVNDLTEKGINQAEDFAASMIGKEIHTIYTSPASRCKFYAKIVGEILLANVVVDSRLGDFSTDNLYELKDLINMIHATGERMFMPYGAGLFDNMSNIIIPGFEIKRRTEEFLAEHRNETGIVAITHLENTQLTSGLISKGSYIEC